VNVAVATVAVLLLAGFLGYSLPTRSNADLPAQGNAASSGGPGTSAPVTAGPSTGSGAATENIAAGPTKSVASPRPSSRQPTHKTSPSTSTSPPKASPNTSGRNLALTGEATASSLEGEHWSASNAVDGDSGTRWSSAFSDPQWLRVDLGARWQISEVRLSWDATAKATAYRVELSTDGTTWKSVYSATSSPGDDITVKVAKLPARFVRMYGTKRASDYSYSVLELDVR